MPLSTAASKVLPDPSANPETSAAQQTAYGASKADVPGVVHEASVLTSRVGSRCEKHNFVGRVHLKDKPPRHWIRPRLLFRIFHFGAAAFRLFGELLMGKSFRQIWISFVL